MFSAIVLAGGTGSRARQAMPKQFMTIAGKPMIMHILERLDQLDGIAEIVVPCFPDHKEQLEKDIRAYMLTKTYHVIDGGDSRQESTRLGLMAAKEDQVLIHEAARPFVTREEFQALLDTPHPSVTYGVNIPFTVSLAEDGRLVSLLDRSRLVNIQLPQKFPRQALLDAHNRAAAEHRLFTEDASILHHYDGREIRILPGSHWNLKITEPVDFAVAEKIYAEHIIGRFSL